MKPTPNRDRADQLLLRAKHLPFILDRVRQFQEGAPADGRAPLWLAHTLLSSDAIEAALWTCIAPFGRIRVDDETGKPFWNGQDLLDGLRAAVLGELQAGTMIAIGFDNRDPIGAVAVEIPAARWRSLTPDFDANTIRDESLVVSGILVFRAHSAELAEFTRAKSGPTPAELSTWYQNRVDQCGNDKPQTEADDLTAAQAIFGNAVTRQQVRDLRKSMAPQSWQRRGRRPHT